MDNSTLGFFAVLIALFIIVKYFTSTPSKNAKAKKTKKSTPLNSTATNAGSNITDTNTTTTTTTTTPVVKARPVTKDMIEIVQQIGPKLTDEQVVYDLQKTGSIEATIDNFLKNGDLPEPPMTRKQKKEKAWGQTKEERSSLLESKREEMILRARMRLRAQLANEIDL